MDDAGNVYITGELEGTADMDPGRSIYNFTSQGLTDIFILKLDKEGNFVWARQIGGASRDVGSCLSVNASGGAIVSGSFGGTVDFGNKTFLTSSGYSDVYVCQYDASGKFQWAKNIGGTTSNDYCHSMVLDSNGDIYLTGIYDDIADFDPSSARYELTCKGEYDVYICRLDKNGSLIWAKSIGGTGMDEVAQITLDLLGNIYITGDYNGLADFNPDETTYYLQSAGDFDSYVCKFNSEGSVLWAASVGGQSFDVAYSLVTDASGNVYCTGRFHITADFNPGAPAFNLTAISVYDSYILKLNTQGIFEWVKQLPNSEATGIISDEWGNLTLIGGFKASVDFDPGPGISSLTPSGTTDQFIVKWTQCNVNTSVIQDGLLLTAEAQGESVEYTWVDCEMGYSSIAGERKQSFTPVLNGNYAVIVSQMGCIDTSECISIQTVGRQGSMTQRHVHLYPNPTTGEFTLSFNALYDKVIVNITNAKGQQIQFGTFYSTDIIPLQIQGPSGAYFLEVLLGEKEPVHLKVIKD